MKVAEIRELTTDEILNRVNDAKEELMNLRFQMATGGVTDYSRFSYIRRDVARMLTIVRERELNSELEGES